MSGSDAGSLILVLHHHLPWVKHPEYEDFMEEDWLYQAVVETYLPLLDIFQKLRADRVPWRLTVSLTPPLIAMLDDPLLRQRTERHLERLCLLASAEVKRTRGDATLAALAVFYRDRLERLMALWRDQWGRDIVSRYGELQESGQLEIITCGATHGFLPLMNGHEPAMRAQIAVAADQYRQRFGRGPRGIWLPECGYQPGVEKYLGEEGIEYFFVDSHGLMTADPPPASGIYAPLQTSEGVAAFARDPETGRQVWSAESGYPGDAAYREFYRDLGWDLPLEYLRPFLGAHGFRKYLGIKYHRVTGPKTALDRKQLYDPAAALERADAHAGNFVFNRDRQMEHLSGRLDHPPVVVAPYDAELFGHWWYEGPDFLNYVIRKAAYDTPHFDLATAGDVLDRRDDLPRGQPSTSSWGHRGYSEFWLNESNDWLYRHLHNAQERMSEAADLFADTDDADIERTLNQAARELLLAQSSDWAFIMRSGTVVDYAVKRSKEHIDRFLALIEMVESGKADHTRLDELENRDGIFPNIDFRIYRTRPGDVLAEGVVRAPQMT